nr:MAG TPA: hypothetical protein [Caudoviricetes sp.]
MPVVNPMVFYWMSVTESLKDFLLFAGIGLCALAIALPFLFDGLNNDELKTVLLWSKRAAVIGVAILVIRIFIPGMETIEKMVIAQNVTYERVEQTADVVSDVYNDIMNLFRENQANQ